MKILLTGSTGFIGKALRLQLTTKYDVICTSRRAIENQQSIITSLSKDTDWNATFNNINIVIHTAAHLPQMNISEDISRSEYQNINTLATLNLAKQAAEAGVSRFIFISSIKVNGESTVKGKPFTADDDAFPDDAYAISKYEAEQGLKKIADETGMEVVIIRPPLVYGPRVKGNFAAMMHWVTKRLPLPLGGINNNRRSFVSIYNLIDLIERCIEHPNAANQTFLVSDDDDMSTSQLLSKMKHALNGSCCLLAIPSSWISLTAKIMGKSAVAERLCGSLQVDISQTKKQLDWTPPFTVQDAMNKTALYFLNNRMKKTMSSSSLSVRFLDLSLAFLGLLITFPILMLVMFIGYFDTGSPIFKQVRVGKGQQPFTLIKFRTMVVNTESVASHLASASSITKFGLFLRKTKLDELPQLINVLKGEMSLVGPRPNLFNQQALIAERECRGVYAVLPGITGLAQINCIDMSTPKLLAETDQIMMDTFSLKNYFLYILKTVIGNGAGDRVK